MMSPGGDGVHVMRQGGMLYDEPGWDGVDVMRQGDGV